MTPPDPQQVAEIAGRLSKAQREAEVTEAVARALCQSRGHSPGRAPCHGIWQGQPGWKMHEREAAEFVAMFSAALAAHLKGNSHD